jgi:hypothetical protein
MYGMQNWEKARVWKSVIFKELRMYEKTEVGGKQAEGRVMLQGSMD